MTGFETLGLISCILIFQNKHFVFFKIMIVVNKNRSIIYRFWHGNSCTRGCIVLLTIMLYIACKPWVDTFADENLCFAKR